MATARFLFTTDFVGDIHVSQNAYKTAELQYYINSYEEAILRCALGDWLYNELYTNYTSVLAKWTELINGKNYTDSYGKTCIYRGIKQSIKYLAYWEIMNIYGTTSLSGGLSEAENSNSTKLDESRFYKQLNVKWNFGVDYYYQLIKFINDNYTIYLPGSQYGYWCPKQLATRGGLHTQTFYNQFELNNLEAGDTSYTQIAD